MAIERIQYRRDTSTVWASVNPILANGEPAYETDTGLVKIGNGVSAWNALPYSIGGGGGEGGAVSSVAGRAGAVVLTSADLTDSGSVGRAALAASTQSAARAAIGAQVSGNYANNSDLTATTAIANGAQTALDAFKATKGANSGLASLDSGGKVPAAQLPSYVDDVVEVGSFASLPVTGETGKIYVTQDTNYEYRWSGSAYIRLVASPGSTDAVPEGTTNLYFSEARAQAALTTALATKAPLASPAFTGTPTGITKTHVGLGNVDNTSDANKPVSTAQAAANTADRARANHTGTQTSATISDLTEVIQDTVAAFIGAGTNVTVSYDDVANTFTVNSAGTGGSSFDAESARDALGTALVGLGNISIVVSDASDTITITTTATVNSTDAALRDRSTHTGSQAISTVTGLQSAIDGKAPLASPAFTGTPTGITKAHVGLSNVDNTSDANKPVSTAQAAANVEDRARANHTGTQATSTINGLAEFIQDTVGTFVAGDNIVIDYDDVANSLTIASTSAGSTVKVVTGEEARPDSTIVLWVGGTEQPTNMIDGDLWATPAPGGLEAPPVPTGVVISAITDTTATVTWDASTGATGYEVQLDGAVVGTPSGTTINLTGLDPETEYSVRVRARDAVPTWSALSTAVLFTTEEGSGGGTTMHNVFGADTDPFTVARFNDGGTALRIANGFYTYGTGKESWRVRGMRIWVPVGATVPSTATCYLFTPAVGTKPNLAAPAQTVTMTGITAGQWNEVLFTTPYTAPVATPIFVGYLMSGGIYMAASNSAAITDATVSDPAGIALPGIYENFGGVDIYRGRFSDNGGTSTDSGTFYGIDIMIDEGA